MKSTTLRQFKPPPPVHRPSGLECISSCPIALQGLNQDELHKFAASLEADESTFVPYHGVKQIRVWEALALHYHLDPHRLMLNKRGRLGELKRMNFLRFDAYPNLKRFLDNLEEVLADASSGKLPCVMAKSNALLNLTTLKEFKEYVSRERMIPYVRHASVKESVSAVPSVLPLFIQHLLEGLGHWKDYDGHPMTPQPKLQSFFQKLNYSENLSAAMATLCRPESARPGRQYGSGKKHTA